MGYRADDGVPARLAADATDVADMIYAAAVAYPGDFAVKFEPHLRAPEAALAK